MKIPRRRFFACLPSIRAIFLTDPPVNVDSSASQKFKSMLEDYLATIPTDQQNPEHIQFLENSIQGWQAVERVRAKALRSQ
jgi:hypothetical protein